MHIHLDHSSPFLKTHHANWRVKSIQALENAGSEKIAFSCVINISKADVLRLREKLTTVIQECVSIAKDSKEEKLYAFSLDFFET